MTSRARSLWGWGYEDAIPTGDARAMLGAQVSAVLGIPEPVAEAPARLDAITIPPPRITPPAALASLFTDARADRAAHTYGKSYRDIYRAFHGDFAAAPDLVAYPQTEGDVAAILAHCEHTKTVLVPFGGGSSVVGGVEAVAPPGYAGVISLDLRALDKVLEVDAVSRSARVQAGVFGPHLEAQLAAHGDGAFSLRHFPQSFEFSTLGGWIATRAGGHFATLYTHIDDLVQSTRTVTGVGIFESRRLPASGAGPSPDRMILGSEGAYGVITEAWVRVQARPTFRASASVHFASFEDAVAATRAVAQAGLYPANCRLLDGREAMINGVTFDGSSVVLLGFESADHPLEPWMERAVALCLDAGGASPKPPVYKRDGARARDEATATSWREAFLRGPYLQSALITLGLVVDTFETACPWACFAALHAAVTEAAMGTMTRVAGTGLLSCRFTHVYPDGPAPYYTFIMPGRRGDELSQWEAVKAAVSEALFANGATITHHHAVGRLHRPWYDRQRPDVFASAMVAAKRALDPSWVLNPGVLIDRG